MPDGLCVTRLCEENYVWIESGCFPVLECDYGVWNGICVSECRADEYFDRHTRLCVKTCGYVNETGRICEDPNDEENCPFL